MASGFSISDMYDKALKKLAEQRGEADKTSKAAFERLDEQTSAAYKALDNEAYVNKALSERASGTAGDRMATIKQRRMSNLRNTLGKNERQRKSFEDSVNLALANYETQRTADDAALSAQYSAAEAAALLNQSNFDKELGLKQKQLELDKQNSKFSHAYELYTNRLMDKGQFKAWTGIDVKSLPKPKKQKVYAGPAVITAGNKAPEKNREGYITRAVVNPDGTLTFYEVREDLAPDMDKKNVSPRDEDGHAKSYVHIYAEINYEGYSGASPSKQLTILQDNKDDFIAHFGENYYILITDYYSTFGNIMELDLDELEPIKDIINHFDTYVLTNEAGVDGVFDLYNEERNKAIENIYSEYPDAVSWEYVRQIYPEIARQFEYTDSEDDNKRKRLGLSPGSFTSAAFVEALQNLWSDEASPQGGLEIEPFVVTQKGMLHTLGVDLETLSVTEILGITAYIDSVVNGSKSNVDSSIWFRQIQRLLEYGENVYKMYATVSLAETLPEGFRDQYVLINLDIFQGSNLDLMDKNEFANRAWHNMPIEQKYDIAFRMLNDYSESNQSTEESEPETTDEETQRLISQGLIPLRIESDILEGTEEQEETENPEKTRMESVLGNSDAQGVIDGILNDTKTDIMNNVLSPEPTFIELNTVDVINFVLNTDWSKIDRNMKYGYVVGGADLAIGALWQSTSDLSDIYIFLTETERNTILYYYGKGFTTNLYHYLNVMEPILKERKIEYDDLRMERFVQEKGPEGEIAAAFISVIDSFFSFPAYFETLEASITGDEVDITSEWQTIARNANTYAALATSTTKNGFARWFEEVLINLAKNLPYYFAGPAGPVLMGLNAAGQTTAQMNRQGYTSLESLMYSTAVGLVETGTEYLAFEGVDAVGNKLLSSAAVTENLLAKALKTAGGIGLKMTPEVMQEFTAGLIENAMDVAFLGENSEYTAIYQQHINEGMTEAQAGAATFWNQFFISPLYQASVALGTSAGMATTSTIRYASNLEGQISAIDGILERSRTQQERSYLEDLRSRLVKKLARQMAQEMADTKSNFNGAQTEGNPIAQVITRLSALGQNTKVSPEIITAIDDFVMAMQNMGEAVPTDVYDNVIAAYRTFEASGTNGNAVTLLNTTMQSLTDAIVQRQATGSDITSLVALKVQLENALSVAGQVQATNPAQQITTQAEALVSALQALPASIKAKIGYDGVFNALLSAQMNGSDVELAQTALDKARAGVEAALEMDGLDAETRAALEGLLGEIGTKDGNNNGDVIELNKNETSDTEDELIHKLEQLGDQLLDFMEVSGGHTLNRHVGKDVEYLAERVKNLKGKGATTYYNKEVATKAVQDALFQHADEISDWLENSEEPRLTINTTHSFDVGAGVKKGSEGLFTGLNSTRIVLQKGENELGFIIITSYPVF